MKKFSNTEAELKKKTVAYKKDIYLGCRLVKTNIKSCANCSNQQSFYFMFKSIQKIMKEYFMM